MKDEIRKIKTELLEPGWTEDLHRSLKELPEDVTKAIVDSMTETEIHSKVNIRNTQSDYISDYIEYLWEISQSAYWRHVKSTLNLSTGLLWADTMFHFDRMCNNEIPKDILQAVLDFAIGVQVQVNYKQDFEAIGCVIKAQVEKFNRMNEINKHISLLPKEKQISAKKRINEMVKCKCCYDFS